MAKDQNTEGVTEQSTSGSDPYVLVPATNRSFVALCISKPDMIAVVQCLSCILLNQTMPACFAHKTKKIICLITRQTMQTTIVWV